MNWNSPLDVLVNAIAATAFLGFLVFVIVYASFSNWRATPPGRALMYAVAALDTVSLMNTVHLFTGPYPGQVFVRIPVYSALALASWRLVVTLIAILRSGQPITVSSLVEPNPRRSNKMNWNGQTPRDTGTPALGNVISSPKIRKAVYGCYAVSAIIVGGVSAYFLGTAHAIPEVVTGAQAVVAYLAIPVGGLALANTPPSS